MPKPRTASSKSPRARHNLPPVNLTGRLGLCQREAATAIGKSPSCLRRWAHVGIGPRFVRVSRRCLVYPIADLNAWLTRNAVDPADAGR